MFQKLFQTNNDYQGLILRIALGVMIFPHGAQKLVGWFGGYGYSGSMQFLTESMGIPYIFALIAILTEFFGGLALVTGFATRLSALGVGFTMLVAAFFHLEHGFFMNWSGSQAGEGIEFHIMAVGIAAALTIGGGGKFAGDHLIAKRNNS